MKLFHIPKIECTTGSLLRFITDDDGLHYAEYTFEADGILHSAVDKQSAEKVYGRELTEELLDMLLPKEVTVYYDAKNLDDSKPDLINFD